VPQPPITPSGLATAIADARDSDSRVQELHYLLAALQIGIYKGDGTAVQRGAERTNDDFYLYDFEVRELALSYGRSDTRTLAGIASWLSSFGVKPDGQDVAPADLGQILISGVRQAVSNPQGNGAFLALTVRELGLHHHPAQDLASDIPVDQVRLDPVQFLLFVAGLTVPILRPQPSSAMSPYRLLADSPCPEVEPEPKEVEQLGDKGVEWTVEKVIEKLSEKIGKALKVISLVKTIINAIHGGLVAFGLRIKALKDSYSTHYGPPGHAAHAGEPIKFQAQVVMLDDLGEDVIRCLAEAGYRLPPKGPVDGMDVRWGQSEGNLLRHGQTSPSVGLLGAKTSTGKDGVATLTFQPKNEALPGKGIVVTDTGVITAYAFWGDYLKNSIAQKDQYLVPLYASMQWNVERHRADLHVDYTLPGSSVRILGTKCDGPVGTWNLRLYGTAGPVEFQGTITPTLTDSPAAASGQATSFPGTWNSEWQNTFSGVVSGGSTGNVSGTATYDSTASTLTLVGSGSVSGSVTVPFLGTQGIAGSSTPNAAIPVQVGVQPECTNS
jgi:hypothetical protein